MQEQSSATGIWQSLSNQTAGAVEKVARAIVAVHGRRRIPASGVHWRLGLIVTANHALERDDEINVTLPGGRTTSAKLAGRAIRNRMRMPASAVSIPDSVPATGDLESALADLRRDLAAMGSRLRRVARSMT